MGLGFFGWTPPREKGAAAQPRWLKGKHFEELELDEALRDSSEVLRRFCLTEAHPGVPAYSGGLLDAWPAKDAQGFAHAKAELEVIEMVRALEQRRSSQGGGGGAR